MHVKDILAGMSYVNIYCVGLFAFLCKMGNQIRNWVCVHMKAFGLKW